jgi:hypothetical protein
MFTEILTSDLELEYASNFSLILVKLLRLFQRDVNKQVGEFRKAVANTLVAHIQVLSSAKGNARKKNNSSLENTLRALAKQSLDQLRRIERVLSKWVH